MTRERALELITLLPDPPRGTRLGWTPWEYDEREGMVVRFGYVTDERHGGQGLAQRVAMWDDFSAVPVSDLIGIALARMMAAEAAIDRTIPLYVAEALIKR